MPKKKTLYMETTEIGAGKTAREITEKLAAAGATQINSTFDNGHIVGLTFVLPTKLGPIAYDLPVRVDPIFQQLQSRRDSWRRKDCAVKDRDQAERVAWRQLLRWVEAQLAMIDTGMVETSEVFMPYAVTPGGRTFYQLFADQGMKLLGAGK